MQSAYDVLLGRVDDLAVQLASEIQRKEPFYREAISSGDLRPVVRANVLAILQTLRAGTRSAPEHVAETARLRAEQGVPLSEVLRAFRLGYAFLWDELVALLGADGTGSQALLRSATSFWNALDEYSEVVASAYQQVEIEQVRRDARMQEAALATLFDGTRVVGSALSRVASALRLPRRGSFVVVATDPPLVAPGSQRAVRAEDALSAIGLRAVWRSEYDAELGLVLITGTHSIDGLVARLGSLDLGRVGLSETFDLITHTSIAAAHAKLAKDVATGRPSGVFRYEDAHIAALLATGPEIATSLLNSVLGPLLDLPAPDQVVLLDTVRAWFGAKGSAAQTAKVLHCHANTVRYRLGKLAQLTGLQLTDPVDVAQLYVALEAWRVLPQPEAARHDAELAAGQPPAASR